MEKPKELPSLKDEFQAFYDSDFKKEFITNLIKKNISGFIEIYNKLVELFNTTCGDSKEKITRNYITQNDFKIKKNENSSIVYNTFSEIMSVHIEEILKALNELPEEKWKSISPEDQQMLQQEVIDFSLNIGKKHYGKILQKENESDVNFLSYRIKAKALGGVIKDLITTSWKSEIFKDSKYKFSKTDVVNVIKEYLAPYTIKDNALSVNSNNIHILTVEPVQLGTMSKPSISPSKIIISLDPTTDEIVINHQDSEETNRKSPVFS